MQEPEKVRCPKCNSEQFHSSKKGFSGTKAVVGGVLTGGIGLLAGTHGSNRIILTCLNCGNKFKPGDKPIEKAVIKKPIELKDFGIDENEKFSKLGCFLFWAVPLTLIILIYYSCIS